jgi:hypothetical protein
MAGQSTLSSFVKPTSLYPQAPSITLGTTTMSEPLSLVTELDQESTSQQASNSTTSSKRKREKPRTGWFYSHMPDPDPQTLYYSKDDRGQFLSLNRAWVCKYCPKTCPKTYKLSGGTRQITTHLISAHGIPDGSLRLEYAQKQQEAIDKAQIAGEDNPQKRRKTSYLQASGQNESIDPNTLENLYVNFIASCNQSLRLLECTDFRNLLFYLNPTIESWLPRSRTTATKWVDRQYKIRKEIQKQKLHSARSVIHIMIDLWSSPNHHSILGVTAVYVDEDGTLEKCVLAIKTVIGGHDGINQSMYVMDVIRDWGIASKLGYMNMDNATNNDVTIKQIALGMYPFTLLLLRLRLIS